MEKTTTNKRNMVLSIILVALVITLLGIIFYNRYNTSHYASTDDAQVQGDFYNITPLASGKLVDFSIKEGDRVVKDQIIGRIDGASTSQNADNNLLRSPVDGVVVKVEAQDGDYEQSAAEPVVAMIVDPKQIYVNANISEKQIKSVKVGEKVDVTIDEYGSEKFEGTVESLGQAANSAFSILPSSTGTFTKVEQTVPVKISMDKTNVSLLPGTNTEVKIHLK